MRRASFERQWALRQWKQRLELDEHREVGRFRKGRRPRGCPRVCVYCRTRKEMPDRQEIAAELALAEWLEWLMTGYEAGEICNWRFGKTLVGTSPLRSGPLEV